MLKTVELLKSAKRGPFFNAFKNVILPACVLVTVLFFSVSPVSADNLGSLFSPGKLSSLHKDLEGIIRCTKCHTLWGGIGNSKCLDCHTDIRDLLKTKRGFHGSMGDEKCIKCHSDHKGRKFSLIEWDQESFKHKKTGYDLIGKHSTTKCSKCHNRKTKKGQQSFLGLSTKCKSCHKDIHKGELSEKCETCHKSIDKWQKITFDHNKIYKLEYKHEKAKCAKCHKKKYLYRVKDYKKCATCHMKDDKHKKRLGTACENCHLVKSWKQLYFNHKKTKFNLRFKHKKVACEKCHTKGKSGDFKVAEFGRCDSPGCHDIRKRGAIHGKQFKGQLCEQCHDEKGWKPPLFKHAGKKYKGFKLKGKHIELKCEKCHVKIVDTVHYKPIETKNCDSLGCHDIKKRGYIHGKQFKEQRCEECHTEKEWKPPLFKHENRDYKGYKLKGKHKDLKCEKCHVKIMDTVHYKPIETKSCDSSGCHDIKERGYIHGKQFKNQRCEECHTEKEWKPPLFKHEDRDYKGYKLKGKHKDLKCEKCHVKIMDIILYKPIETKSCDSIGCHDIPKRGYIHGEQFKKQRCEDCHTEKEWKPPLFKHDDPKYKGYKLKGKHVETKCEKCHVKIADTIKYKPIETKRCDSGGCHDIRERGYIHDKQFRDRRCDECHNEKGWKPPLFKHNDQKYKGYKLKGKHEELKCEKCHVKIEDTIRYIPINTKSCDIGGCHDTKERGNIHGNQFRGKRCRDCHTEKAWKELIFNHDNQSIFSLQGKHEKTKCEKCHKDKKWKPIPIACIDCHKDKDIHKGKLGNKCAECHNAESWEPRKYAHDLVGFRLEGAHGQISCVDCHKEKGKFTGLGPACLRCHTDPHFNQFGTFCSDCHTDRSWLPERFRHGDTGFRLEGIHRMTECEECHQNRNYRATSTLCYDCHYVEAVQSGAHKGGLIGFDCSDCHISYGWETTRIRHKVMTFSGYHATIRTQCDLCHNDSYGNGFKASASISTSASDCGDCHTLPGTHLSGNNECTQCHNTTAWTAATYRDHLMIFSGPHIAIKTTCSSCHTSNYSYGFKWTGASVSTTADDCYHCHEADYTGSSNLAHSFGDTVCLDCHSRSAWAPASFSHSTMTFTGAHRAIGGNCDLCHTSGSSDLKGKYTGASTEDDCEICHFTDDFKVGTITAHGFNNTNCQSCHNTTDWSNATAGHTVMTFNGKHKSEETNCGGCHSKGYNIVGGTTTEADCVVCHLSEYNGEHDGDPNCDTNFCSICHSPNDGRDFDGGRENFGCGD